MNPIQLVGKNVYKLTSSSTGTQLSAIASRGLVFIPWEPSKEEIKAMSDGKPLWTILKGNHIPEYQLIVGEQEMIIPRDVRQEMVTGPENREILDAYAKQAEVDRYWTEWVARILAAIIFISSSFLVYVIYKWITSRIN